MSTTIDQKVLEMRFDNKQFEENVTESISTLDKLKGALNFDKLSGAFGSISSAAGKVDFSPISSGVETVIVKFNALEMAAVQAIANIITNGINKLQSAINELTFEQIGQGWDKYEEKTQSVQTIMAATGKDIEEVNAQLDRLNWFSDETSYSFTDMTSNVGKFTSVGVDLETAVTAMQGISTWAALAGANVPEASRAMYNLSQAMGVGAVKLMDWKSIENAGMATQEFKETVLDTAAAMGTLRKYTDGTYQTLEGTTVSVKNFNSTLAEGWFSSEVLLESLDAYGGFANELAVTTEKYGGLTSNWIDAIDEFGTGTDALNALMEDTGMTAEELYPILQKLSGEEYDLGRKAFKAAQEAKTFSDAIEATKDAVSTQWMNTFEYLFGNYEEAKDFFTEMTEIFYDLFAESGNTRNEILEQWSEQGFGDVFRTGILDVLWGVAEGIESLKIAFQEIFPEATVENTVRVLQNLTVKFADMAKRFRVWANEFEFGETVITRLRSVFDGFGAVLNIVKQAFSALSPVFSAIKDIVFNLADDILTLSARFGDWLVKLSESIRENDTFAKALAKVHEIISPVIEKIKELYSAFKGKLQTGEFLSFEKILGKIGEKLKPVKEFLFGKNIFDKDSFMNGDGPLKHVPGLLEKIGNGFSTIWEKIKGIDLSGIKQGFSDFFSSVKTGLKNAFKDFNIGTFLSDLGKGISNLMESLGNGDFSKLFSNLTKGTMLFGGFNLAKLFGSGSKALESITGEEGGFLKNLLSPVTDTFDQLKETIGSFTKDVNSPKLINIAVAIGILAASLVALSNVDSDKMDVALTGLVAAFATLTGEMKFLSSMSLDKKQTSGLKSIGLAMIEIAAAVAIMVKAVKPLAEMEWGDLAKAGAGMTAIMGIMLAFTAVFGAISRANTKGVTDPKGGFFSLFQKSNGFDKQMIKVAEAMILLGAAMKIFVSAIQGLGGMSLAELGKGLGGMTAIMLEMIAFIAVASKLNTSGIMKTALAMVVLGAAMKIFESVISGLGKMDSDNAKQGIIAMTAVMVEMLAFIFIASKIQASAGNIAGLAAAMIILGLAMKTFASAMQDFAKFEPGTWLDPIKQMGLVLAGMLAFMVTAKIVAASSGQILVIASSMIVLGLAMKAFASAAQDFSKVEWSDLGKMGASIAGFIAILVVMGALVGPLTAAVGVLTGIGVALMAIGAGLTLIGVGLTAINLGSLIGNISVLSQQLHLLVAEITKGFAIDNLLKIIKLLPEVIVESIAGVVAGIISGFGMIVASFGDLISGIKDMLLQLIDLLVEVSPPLVKGFCKIVVEALKSLSESLPEMIVYLADILIKLFDGISEYVPQIVASLVKLLCKVFDSLSEHIPELLTSFMNFAGKLFGEIMKALDKASPDAVIKMIEMVGFLDALIVSCALLKGMIPGAMAGLVELGLFVAELSGIIAALGLLYKIDGFEELVEGGGELLQDIGTALGKLVGGVVGGIAAGATASLPEIGTNLSGFMTNLQPFIDGVSAIGEDTINSITNLSVALLALTAGDLINGITSLLTGESSFESFGNELASFGPSFKTFADSVAGIDSESITAVSGAIATIANTFNTEVFKSGGLKQLFTGETSLTTFAEGLAEFGPKLNEFADSVKSFDDTGVEKSCSAIGKIAEAFNKQVFRSGGLAGLFAGDINLTSFADGLAEFGPKLASYADSVKSFDDSGIETSTKAIETIANGFNKEVFKSGGLKQLIEGQTDFTDFANGLANLGPALMKYSIYISKIDDNLATKSTTLCTSLSTMLQSFPSKSLWEQVFGTDGTSNFIDDLNTLADGLIEYQGKIAEIDTEKMGSVTTAVKSLFDAITGVDTFFVGYNENFSTSMRDIAMKGIDAFIAPFDERVDDIIARGSSLYTNVIEGMKTQDQPFTTQITTTMTSGLTEISNNKSLYLTAGTDLFSQVTSGIAVEEVNVITAVTTILTNALTAINNKKTDFNTAGQGLMQTMAAGVKMHNSTVVNNVKEIVSNMLQAIENRMSDFNSKGSSVMYEFGSGISSAAGSVESEMYSIGLNISQGLADGMNANVGAVQAAAEALANAASGAAATTLEVNSPSRVFYRIGSYAGEGFVNGLAAWKSSAESNSIEVADTAVTAMAEAIEGILQNDLDVDPVIRPVLDTSDIEAGSRRINNLISTNKAYHVGSSFSEVTKTSPVPGSVDNSRNFGGFTFNIYSNGTNAKEVAKEIGIEVNRRMRQFGTI